MAVDLDGPDASETSDESGRGEEEVGDLHGSQWGEVRGQGLETLGSKPGITKRCLKKGSKISQHLRNADSTFDGKSEVMIDPMHCACTHMHAHIHQHYIHTYINIVYT